MGRKGKLFGLLAVFAVIAMVTASGAFTSVTAERTATVDVAADSNALLVLEQASSPNGQEYAQENNGQLEITLDNVNPNATTVVESVFVIRNQGTQEVNVSIEDSGNNDGAVTFYNESSAPASNGGLEPGGGNATLRPGESVTVSIEIDTTGIGASTELVDSITVSAEATGN